MDLHKVAVFFDRTVAADAYTPGTTFLCQIEPLDMYRTEGTRIKIRDMSTAPTVTIPSRRAINIDGQVYLVSDASKDHWNGTVIRNRYVIQGVEDLVSIYTIPQLLAATPTGVSTYALVQYNRYSTDERDSSEYHAQYLLTFGPENIPEDGVVYDGSKYFLIREKYRAASGLINVVANELVSPIATVTINSPSTYDPVTETYSGGGSVSVKSILVRWQEHFRYLSQGSTSFESGDMQALVVDSLSVKADDRVTISGVVWRVLSTLTYSGYQSLHVRRA